MKQFILGSFLCAPFILAGLAPAIAGPCDDGSECNFRVRNFNGSYPNEKERVNWECFDQSSKISISCTFVRGDDILKYSDVYVRVQKQAPRIWQAHSIELEVSH
jgi:hypothetical protein